MSTQQGRIKLNQIATTEPTEKTFNPDDDYYLVLGLECDCTQKDIKSAYKKLANEHHPDKENGNDKWFHQIKEAFNVLIDPKSRANYDEYGRFTQDEYQNARDYIKSVIDQVVAQVEDLAHLDMVQTLIKTTQQNIINTSIELKNQKQIQDKFEKNEHRSKNTVIKEVFSKHKGIAITTTKQLKKDFRTFEVAMIMLQDYEYNFDMVEPI